MQVKEVMTRTVEEVPADAPLMGALEKLDGGVLAVSEAGQLRGMLTEHDIARWQTDPGHDPRTARVRDVLNAEHGFLTEETDVRDAAKIMQLEHVSGMVVVRDQRPVGRVTLADLASRISSNVHLDSPPPARVVLQPIAAPSILGYLALAAASLVVGAHAAGWYGNTGTPLYQAAFVGLFGGLTQFLAGMWAYRARDAVATAIHGAWGAFFGAYGLLYLLVANGTLAAGAVNQNLGFWYIPLAAISVVAVFAALADSGVLSGTLFVFAIAAGIAGVASLVGDTTWIKVGGYLFMVGALCAWYLASALLLEGAWRRVILPLGRTQRGTNRPGSNAIQPIEYQYGEPGVRAGQ